MIKLFVMAMLGAAVAFGTAGVASASTAGSQSVPPLPPVANPLPPGGFSSVVTSQPITAAAGGTVGPAMVAGADVTVHVPAGAFSGDVQIVLTEPDLAAVPTAPGFMVVAGVGVGVSINGTPYQGTFLKPITVDISSPKITASSEVGAWTGSAFVPDTSSMLSAGMATITMDSDAAFIVLSPIAPAPAPVPSATSPVTGEPFLGEGILAGLLLLGGTGALFTSRRRRAKAASAGPAQELRAGKRAGAISPQMPQPARGMTTATRVRESDHKTGGSQ